MNKKIIMLCTALLCLTYQIARAQENKKFLDDYFLGGVAERTLIVRDIDELTIAREMGRQAVLLSRCKNYKTLDTRTDFDSYTEELQKVLVEKGGTINALSGFATLSLAAALNEFSDDDIMLINAVMAKSEYVDMMSYIWFESVMRQLTEGLIDVNTNTKQPWIAARALSYLKNHKLYPLFLITLTAAERELLNQDVFTSLQPAAVSNETKYTEALSQLFENQLKNKALLKALPTEITAFIGVLQDGINPQEKRALGSLSLLVDSPTDLACRSSNKRNCVSNEWFKDAKSAFNATPLTRLDIARALLHDKYKSLCEQALDSSGTK